jgi:hypothetical protein
MITTIKLPKTTGRWDKVTVAGHVVAYIELFKADGRWFTIPGASRYIEVGR